MKNKTNYQEKFEKIVNQTKLEILDENNQIYIKKLSFKYLFSFQDLKQIVETAIDLNMWDEGSLETIVDETIEDRKKFLKDLYRKIELLKNTKSYENFTYEKPERKPEIVFKEKGKLGLGECPVASEKTRCCNLLTLDAVESCGFDCSYCAIGSFYNQDKISFDPNFQEKLKNLQLDPNKKYHIGTGQASDSLLYGNRNNTLKALFEFAEKNPNVILELKSKSKNITYLKENKIPKNIITTWSLNTPTIIKNEEHLSATLEERLASARVIADKNRLVGFHFHPMVHYEGWREEYKDVFNKILEMFKPEEVALISIGTLTFIKPVIKKLRDRNFKSKILQMDMEDASGKFSYSNEKKLEMFKFLYDSFKPWQEKVYFYMCMENIDLWKLVFGYEYSTNNDFEEEMIKKYYDKIYSLNIEE